MLLIQYYLVIYKQQHSTLVATKNYFIFKTWKKYLKVSTNQESKQATALF